jgi:plasmid stability protein
MAQLLVRNLDDEVKERLKSRARRHGRSTEAEVREILIAAVTEEGSPRKGLGTEIIELFAGIGLDEEIPELRGQPARPATFDE